MSFSCIRNGCVHCVTTIFPRRNQPFTVWREEKMENCTFIEFVLFAHSMSKCLRFANISVVTNESSIFFMKPSLSLNTLTQYFFLPCIFNSIHQRKHVFLMSVANWCCTNWLKMALLFIRCYLRFSIHDFE